MLTRLATVGVNAWVRAAHGTREHRIRRGSASIVRAARHWGREQASERVRDRGQPWRASSKFESTVTSKAKDGTAVGSHRGGTAGWGGGGTMCRLFTNGALTGV